MKNGVGDYVVSFHPMKSHHGRGKEGVLRKVASSCRSSVPLETPRNLKRVLVQYSEYCFKHCFTVRVSSFDIVTGSRSVALVFLNFLTPAA